MVISGRLIVHAPVAHTSHVVVETNRPGRTMSGHSHEVDILCLWGPVVVEAAAPVVAQRRLLELLLLLFMAYYNGGGFGCVHVAMRAS